MERGRSLILIASTFIGITMMLLVVVQADVLMIRPETLHTKTYGLNQGDAITWEWTVIGQGNVDFWIEDIEGTRYRFVDNVTSDSGSFVVPRSGEWSVKLYNDSPDPAGATIYYTITIVPPENGPADPPVDGLVWTVATIGIAVIVVVLVFALLLLRKRRK